SRKRHIRDRPEGEPTRTNLHRKRGQAAVWHGNQSCGQSGARYQSGGQLHFGTLHPRKKVKVVDTVAMGEQVSAVAFTPDGKRALAVKNVNNKAALLQVDGEKVTYAKYDMLVGLFPYNLGITPNGKLALTANNGNSGAA